MALTLELVLQNILANQITTEMDTGAGTSNMKLETSADGEVATINFPNPSFGASVAGVITLLGVPLEDTSATGGTVAQFSLYDRNGDKQLEGVVQVSGADLDLTSLSVGATDTVELTSFSLTVPV